MGNLTRIVSTVILSSVPLFLWAASQKGEIKCDGSSTVYLITEAIATNFKKQNPDVQISVGISGTGGGFKKFSAGETDISDASRKISAAEHEACQKNKVDYVELQIAWDGLTVAIHPDNVWAKSMTVDQLRKIWHPDSAAKKWSDVDPAWPAEEIKLFGAGPDSGTFDFFTEAINGKVKVSRTDYQASEDDNTTVQGVAGNKYAMGYFGLAYFEENKNKLQAVAIIAKEGGKAVVPTQKTVLDKTYTPLSRPLYIYVKKASLTRPEVVEFVKYYLRRNDLVNSAKYIPLSQRQLTTQQESFDALLATIGKSKK